MKKTFRSLTVVCGMLALAALIGCGSPEDKEDDHDHHHHHHHGSDTPHGGHLIDLTPADYVAEWTHDDKAGKLTVYILDAEGKKDVAIATDTVKITGAKKIGGSDEPLAFEYPLIAADATNDDPPKASRFENSKPNPNLITDVKMGKAVSAMLEFEVDGKKYQGVIEHDHHH